MSDLIRRTDAIKAVEDLPNAYNGWSDAYDKACIISTLEEVPKADRPQGEWIIHSNGKMCDCSACNESYDRTFEYVDEWNYCPNCGAKMKGADDE